MNDNVAKNVKIKLWDWLLMIGLCLAPMTGFRLWKIGPAELLCFIWGLKFLIKRKFWVSDILKFYICFLLAMLIGTLIGMKIAPNELRLTDLLVWLYLAFVAVLFYEGLYQNSLEYNTKLLFIISQASIAWYFFLYLYSIVVSRTFFGAPLWYSSLRFSGGGKNPHQVAVLLCGVTFIFLWEILKHENVLKSLLFIGGSLFLLFQTKSSTGIMAIMLGFMISFYFKLADWYPNQKIVARTLLFITICIVGILGYSYFYNRIMLWIASDPNGMLRLVIFSSILTSFEKSPVFGLGPGVHGLDGTIEFHNTYLEILAATGLVGVVIFVFFSFCLFRKVIQAEWRLFPVICTLYAYGFAGFAMRRLIYWGITVCILVIAEQIIKKRIKMKAEIETVN